MIKRNSLILDMLLVLVLFLIFGFAIILFKLFFYNISLLTREEKKVPKLKKKVKLTRSVPIKTTENTK